MEVRYYETESGRSPGDDFIASVSEPYRASIRADLTLLAVHGDGAPVSTKPIKGSRPLWELRTGGYRVFFVRVAGVYWVLGACKKQDQKREIAACVPRMKRVLGG